MMSSAPAALVTKNSRSRAVDERGARPAAAGRRRRGHRGRRAACPAVRRPRRAGTPTTAPARRRGRRAPLAARRRGCRGRGRPPGSMLPRTSASAYSRIVGLTPLATIRGTACVTSAERGERGQHGRGLGRAGLHLHRHLGRHGQRALGADEQLGQVVAGRALHELAAGAQHPAVGQHDLEAEDVVAGHAVADGTHAAGVGADVAAERGALLAGRHRIGQPERQQRRVELFERDARLDDGDLVLGVDLADAVHPVEGQQDPVGHGARRRPRARCRCRGR